ncbi:hypothetical protein Pmani_027314 [Petrolisthes manimaculis]|uniref:Uncharacterized protein n=1 Tax=Petrolisthes manimaculis TaxID=1843537 RepID=A0AAE1P1V7_9EUCA|nr:hypothetical protein Pmani_027314 [Petrolisthes manimaculis]
MWQVRVVGVVGGLVIGGMITAGQPLNNRVIGGQQFYDNRYTNNNQGFSNSGGNPSYGSHNTNPINVANTNNWSQGGGNHNNGGNGYNINNNNMHQQQVYQTANDYNSILQQPTNPGYYDTYGTTNTAIEYGQDPYVAASTYSTGAMGLDTTDSSPALSALALLGFLYFLNLIQDVLQNNNGRRKRSLTSKNEFVGNDTTEENEHYFTHYFGEEPEVFKNDEDNLERTEESQDVELPDNSQARSFSFLEDFFIRLPQKLGLKRMLLIDRGGEDKKPMGIGNFITTRLKMISTIMSFLQNPSPYRVRRSPQDINNTQSVAMERGIKMLEGPSLDLLIPLIKEVLEDHNTLEPQPFKALESENLDSVGGEGEGISVDLGARARRHSSSSMNAWYKDLGGRSVEPSQAYGIASKVASILGTGENLQDAVRKETMPALVELSRGLDGSHPHCLQRALCRLNSHSHELSFVPRLVLQLLSNNLAGAPGLSKVPVDNTEAIKAGRRGENCSQTFSECDTSTTLGKT